MLPKKLLKETRPKKITPVYNERRVIRIQVAVLLVIIAVTAGVFGWIEYRNHQTALRALDVIQTPAVTVTVPIKVIGDSNRLLNVTDTVHTPTITVFGKVEEYVTLRSEHGGFDVRVNKTSVSPNSLSGEFVQIIQLHEGVNSIPITVAWEGADHFQYTYTITYGPTIDGSAPTSTLTP